MTSEAASSSKKTSGSKESTSLIERLEAQGIEIDESLLFEDNSDDVQGNIQMENSAEPSEGSEEEDDDVDKLSSEDNFDHFTPEEIDLYHELGRTPPRTRLEKINRKWKDNKKHQNEMAYAATLDIPGFNPNKRRVSLDSPKRRRNSHRKLVSFPAGLDAFIEQDRSQYEQKKRATYLSRDQERTDKFDVHDIGSGCVPSSSTIVIPSSDYDEDGGLHQAPPHVATLSTTNTTTTASSSTSLLQSPISYESMGHADSLPIAISPLPSALKVETTNRFSSLISKPVSSSMHAKDWVAKDGGMQTPHKKPSLSGNDRQVFYKVFTAMLKSNQLATSDAKWDQTDGLKGRHAAEMQSPNTSYEDTMLYESKTNDVIWLELQAWFAGMNPTDYDSKLVEMRRNVERIIKEILAFRFQNKLEFSNSPSESPERKTPSREISVVSDDNLDISEHFYDAQESLPGSFTESTLDSMATIKSFRLQDFEFDVNSEDYQAQWSLDVFDKTRIRTMNKALNQIAGLLLQLDTAESFYASSKMFRIDHPEVGSQEFKSRVKCLCMWYNLTQQLRSKIDLLGQVLLGPNRHHARISSVMKWPKWSDNDSVRSEESGVNSPMSLSCTGSTFEAMGLTPSHSRNSSLLDVESLNASAGHSNNQRVRFKIEGEEILPNTNPSDSNNSTTSISTNDSGSVSASQQPASVLNNPNFSHILGPPPQVGQNRQLSTLSSISSAPSSQTDISSFDPMNPLRKYVDYCLKTKGLRKTMAHLQNMIRGPLRRAKLALEKPLSSLRPEYYRSTSSESASRFAMDSGRLRHPHLSEERFSSHPVPLEDEKELAEFGTWNPEFRKMNLPSFRAIYLFLAKIPLDVIHECLKIRLEQKPSEPSELSIRQLMRECKEALRLGVIERQKYISRVRAAIYDPEMDRDFVEQFEEDMEEFDEKLMTTLEVYLSYLQNFVTMIQSDSSLLISTYQKSLLEEEWLFTKQTCPHIPDGESFAGNTFCQLVCGMLRAIGNFLNSEIDAVVSRMFVYPDTDGSEDDIQMRHQVYEACRGFQAVFGEARERALKALAFAKTLRKDLEVAAEFTINTSTASLVKKLEETGHARVVAPHATHHQIFISGNIKDRQDHILQLLDMHCGSDPGLSSKSEANQGYLILLRWDFPDSSNSFKWNGETILVKPTAETTISLSQIEVEGVLLVASSAHHLTQRRREFMARMKDVLNIKHDQRATSHKIACSLEQVKQEALNLREKISQELLMVQEKCDVSGMGDLDPSDREALSRRTREILHQCYKFGFEFHKELERLVTGQQAKTALARGVIKFSHQWISFVLERCDRGKGSKPRWAAHGIEFLYFAANTNFTRYLTNEEFTQFKTKVEECYNFVIGEPPPQNAAKMLIEGLTAQPVVSPTTTEPFRPRSGSHRSFSRSGSRSRHSSPGGYASRKTSHKISVDCNVANANAQNNPAPDTGSGSGSASATDEEKMARIAMPPPNSPFVRRSKKPSTADEPDTPDVSYRINSYMSLPWRERVAKSVEALERLREQKRYEEGIVGTVMDQARKEDRIHIKSKTVSFSWQRGNKIGQGHFGKVYTAINNETGDIMAMKEIPLQPNDHKTLRNVADELRIFESIHHKHLINHYGVEVHREEMLIFMEYCPEGTLEELVSTTETGLDETLIRRYTRQLLEAVATLHEHGVVHRDIKGANIFLTDDMQNLKLGDFGCAVKIKAHTTMPGELQGFVGTQAYMAPEVFTKNMSEGHGRAADIWSVGCVVIEMATGKRPWHELESNYQIMFKVGMGESPPVPEKLSNEGKDFLSQCFEHDPRQRSTAHDLLNTPFLKVYMEEENQSLPMFQSLADLGADFKKLNLVRKPSNY